MWALDKRAYKAAVQGGGVKPSPSFSDSSFTGADTPPALSPSPPPGV